MQEHRLGHNILERHLLCWQVFSLFLAICKSYRTFQKKQVFLFNLDSSQYFKNSESSGELFSNHIYNTHFSGSWGHASPTSEHARFEGEGYFKSWNHKTPWVGKDFQILSSPTSLPWARTIFHWIQLLKAPFSLTLSGHGTSTASLGDTFQCLTTLIAKKSHPYIQSKLTIFQFKAVAPHSVTKGRDNKFVPPFLTNPL